MIQEERRGGPGQPFAHKTQLGWTIQGPSSSKENCQASVNFIHESVDLQLQRLWTTDFPERQHDDEQLPSIEDKEAIRLVQDSTERHDNRFIIGMPWKTKKESIPNNKVVAERRLEGLRRKLISSPDLKTKYKNAIDDYLNEGYAEMLQDETPNPKTGVWYIPHHAVVNPNKEKIRVVFDCASSFKGKSLNDHLYQGPDLLNSLVGMLLRFRLHPVAIVADIKAMLKSKLKNATKIYSASCGFQTGI